MTFFAQPGKNFETPSVGPAGCFVAGISAACTLITTSAAYCLPQLVDTSTTPAGSDVDGIYDNTCFAWVPNQAGSVTATVCVSAAICKVSAGTTCTGFAVFYTDAAGACVCLAAGPLMSAGMGTGTACTLAACYSITLDGSANQKGLTVRYCKSSGGASCILGGNANSYWCGSYV